MAESEPSIVKRSIFSWIMPGNVKLQLLLLLIIGVMIFARVLPLEMQKRIVNEAIKLQSIDLLLMYCGINLVASVVCPTFWLQPSLQSYLEPVACWYVSKLLALQQFEVFACWGVRLNPVWAI